MIGFIIVFILFLPSLLLIPYIESMTEKIDYSLLIKEGLPRPLPLFILGTSLFLTWLIFKDVPIVSDILFLVTLWISALLLYVIFKKLKNRLRKN